MDKENIMENITENIKISDNLEILRKHFPACFDKEGKFNLEKFKEEIKINEINLSKESYGLEWLGKSYARVLTFEPAKTLLKANEDWNNKKENKKSGNILIKGDNIEVLKHLVNAYYEKIKMIYIDPPYNTGSDGFAYQDDRKFTVNELMELAGVNEERAKRILDFVNSKSNSHSAWLTFMYPRLYIARRLLKDDGVIFVSIDDNEVAQLRLLMDEIFGEENFVAELIWDLGTGTAAGHFTRSHEYILVYSNNKSNLSNFTYHGKASFISERAVKKVSIGNPASIITFKKGIKFEGKNAVFKGIIGNSEKIEILSDEMIFKNGKLEKDVTLKAGWAMRNQILNWINGKETYDTKGQKVVEFFFDKKGVLQYKKIRGFVNPQSVLRKVGSTRKGSQEIANIFGVQVFDFPKPASLLYLLINLITNPNALILDFFAGSGTTGDAVMQLNAEDGGYRKFILVQLPEPIDPKKNKTAYDFVKNELGVQEPTIFEICKERLVRAAKKIKKDTIDNKIKEKEKEIKELKQSFNLENEEEKIKQLKKEIKKLKNQDLGFKIFETMPIWEDYLIDEKKLSPETELFEENNLSDKDLQALLITWKTYDGLPLTVECKELKLNDYTAYHCGANLYLLYSGWDTKNIKILLEKIDSDKNFVVEKVIVFGYNFKSTHLREIEENIKNYSNKKQIDIETILRF